MEKLRDLVGCAPRGGVIVGPLAEIPGLPNLRGVVAYTSENGWRGKIARLPGKRISTGSVTEHRIALDFNNRGVMHLGSERLERHSLAMNDGHFHFQSSEREELLDYFRRQVDEGLPKVLEERKDFCEWAAGKLADWALNLR